MKRADGGLFLVAGDPGRRGRGKDPLLEMIFARIGRTRPRVAYVGAASSDNRLFFLWIAALLKKAGAGEVGLVPLASRRADAAAARSLLELADVVFVSGGDVELGMRLVERTGVDALLKGIRAQGRPFIGMSAGSIMLAAQWVRWGDAADEATAAAFPCLGLAPLLCDTHAEKEGWPELRMLLRLTAAPVGYGIPAGGALQVDADGSLAALGRPVQRIALGSDLPELKP